MTALNPKSKHFGETLKTIVPYFESVEVTQKDGTKADEVFNRYAVMFGEIEATLLYKSTVDSLSEERKWRRWADEVLVHTLSPNIYRTFDESLRSFNYFSKVGEWEKHFAKWERILVIYVGASAMYLLSKKLKKRYSLKDDVRLSLYDECRYWIKSIGDQRKFMGGESPNLADLVM